MVLMTPENEKTMTPTYVSTHTHSEYSLLDGVSSPDELASRAKELGMPAMALTDHGRMSGLVAFEKACHKHGVKPLLGMEAYCCGIGRSRKERVNYTAKTKELVGKPGHEKTNNHLIIIAKSKVGYENLCSLTSESYATGYYYKPRIDYELLKEHKEGLIVCSACVMGELSMAMQDHDEERALRVAGWFKEQFGDDYYIEVQNHGLPQELAVMRDLRDIADYLGIKTIVANDSHYTYREDAKLQKTLMLLGMHKSWADDDVRGSYFDDHDSQQRELADGDSSDSDPIFETSSELYMKSYDEMVEACGVNGGENGRVQQELAYTLEIADKCEYEIPFIDPEDTGSYILPTYDIKTDVKYDEYVADRYELPEYIRDACVRELREEGFDDVHAIDDYMSVDEIGSLTFLMWLCERGLRNNVLPKLQSGGKPVPDSLWIDNKPKGMEVIHTLDSPDEKWVRRQMDEGKSIEDMLQIYKDRLAYETGVVVAKRFVNYFLIVQSYVNYVKAQGEMVGPGRGCLTPDNMILTENNAKMISEIVPGDIVYDEKGVLSTVQHVYQYDVTENMTDITVFNGGHIKLTDDHKILVSRAIHNKYFGISAKRRQYDDRTPITKREWIPASEVECGDWIFIKRPHREIIEHNNFDLAQFIPQNINNRCEVQKNNIIRYVGYGNGHVTDAMCQRKMHRETGISRHAIRGFLNGRTITQEATKKKINDYTTTFCDMTADEWKEQYTGYHHLEQMHRYIPITKELMQFIGYYIADGCVHRREVVLAFNSADTQLIQKYSMLTKKLFGIDMRCDKSRNGRNLVCGVIVSPIIGNFIKTLIPETVESKKIPDVFMTLDDECTTGLIQGLIDGDGSIKAPGKVSYCSISRTLVYQLRYLLMTLGYIGQVRARHHEQETWHTSYTLTISASDFTEKALGVPDKKNNQSYHMSSLTDDDYFCMRVKYVKSFYYDGTVYDLKINTKNEPSYTTEAGIVHNSGAGSILNYLSRITDVDPIPNNLLFFRFLNKDRKGYPDIDCDFSGHSRDDILWPYLRQTYGFDNTSMVAAYTYFWGKAAIKAAARVLFDCSNARGMTNDERRHGKDTSVSLSNALCDLIDNKPKLDLRNELTDDVDKNGNPLGNMPLKNLIRTDPRYQQIIDLALRLQGLISGESQHASAYILAPTQITDKLPLMVSKDERERSQKEGTPVTDYIIQYDGREIQDQLGYVKMDLLCINDLEVITKTLRVIKDVYDADIDIEKIPLDCKQTFALLQQGKTSGVFQFDGSPVPRRLIMEGKASNINDLSMINALDRPGALLLDMDKAFVKNKQNKDNLEYFSPDAKDILESTYSLAVYQEQTMLLSQNKNIVGFTESESDTMRKILAHKDKDKIQSIVDLAHERAKTNHVPDNIVNQFCDLAVASGSYQFNHCCSGDTTLYRAASGWRDTKYPTQEIPIKEVYRRFNASAARNSPDRPIRSKYRSKRPDMGLFVICRDADGRARKHKVKNVFQQGVRPLYKVTLENGKSGKFTANHRLQAEHGYKRIDELCVGIDSLWCCDFEYEKCKTKYNLTDAGPNHSKGNHWGSTRYGSDNPGYYDGGYTRFMEYRNSFDGFCECCGKRISNSKRYKTHHIDGNRKNNVNDNLENLCVSCHKKKHYAMGRVRHGQKGYPTYLSKIVSIEYVGEEMTYDVEIESDEHNFFANGICSHNSHSLSYATIAYRGAFLKTFFPECFLASVSQTKPQMKGKDKIPDYLNEAKQLGVTIRPPHVNYSEVGFSVPEKHVIAYGLNRIKSVGVAADKIVAERQRGGEFTDLTDFCCRVPKTVTKSALKALITAGALDNLGWTRKAMVESMDDIVKFRKDWFKEHPELDNGDDANSTKQATQLSLGLDLGTSVLFGSTGNNARVTKVVGNADEYYRDGRHHNDHGTILPPPHDIEYDAYRMMRKEHETFGTYFDTVPEDYTQLTRLKTDMSLAQEQRQARKSHRQPKCRHINIADIPNLPDKTRVAFTAYVDDFTAKHAITSGYREFKGGNGATVFLTDWGRHEEGRFGFSPTKYRARLSCFSAVWSEMPRPRPHDALLVRGRISVSDTFPTSVIADEVRTLDVDAVTFRGHASDGIEMQRLLQEIADESSNPASDAYLVPKITLPDKRSYERFKDDARLHAKYDDPDGNVVVTYTRNDTSDDGCVMHLSPTVGMVKYAMRQYGARVGKRRYPPAELEMSRRF